MCVWLCGWLWMDGMYACVGGMYAWLLWLAISLSVGHHAMQPTDEHPSTQEHVPAVLEWTPTYSNNCMNANLHQQLNKHHSTSTTFASHMIHTTFRCLNLLTLPTTFTSCMIHTYKTFRCPNCTYLHARLNLLADSLSTSGTFTHDSHAWQI